MEKNVPLKKLKLPWPLSQWAGASFHAPKDRGFDSWSEHIPRLQVQSLLGAWMGDNQLMFLSH